MEPAKFLVLTQGDPAGIGPETVAKAFRDEPELMRDSFVVGNLTTLRRAAACVRSPGEPELPVAKITQVTEVREIPLRCMPVLEPPGLPGPLPFGIVSAEAGRAAADCVRWAAQRCLSGELCAMVTAPLNKESLHAAGVDFPGHTELLQFEAATHAGVALAQMPVRMMLASDELCVVLVSIHMALRAAIDAVTVASVAQTLQITHQALRQSLGREPHIAVAGLNPHAGENGMFGVEELAIITPAISLAQSSGINATGPWSPDTVFMRARNCAGRPGGVDAVVAMYHDQGLIPLKYLGVDKGVNITLGLPLVRTSPDHGTAFDIAGTGRADASSLIAAVRWARRISRTSA